VALFLSATGAIFETAVPDDDRHVVPLTLLLQAVITVLVAALAGISLDRIVATSVLLGGMVALVPNAFLAARLLSSAAEVTASSLMRSAWLGLLGKAVLTALLFALIFASVRPISAGAVFGGFIAAQFVVLGALLIGRARGGEATTKS
jgi:ATP synthase protein I